MQNNFLMVLIMVAGMVAGVLMMPGSVHARDRRAERGPVRWDVRRSQTRAVPVVILPRAGYVSSRPPGWDRGRKTGWGNCNLPPGLAKKYGCGSVLNFDGRYDDRVRDRWPDRR